VAAPLLEGPDAGPRFVDLCLGHANVQQRMTTRLRDHVSTSVWFFAPQLASLQEEAHLVHGDFGNRNVLVRKVTKKWTVSAVLDWEFAIAGSPLTDVGHPVKEDVKKKTLLPSPLREAVWLASSPASVLLLLRGVLGFVRALDRRVVQRRCQPQWLIPT